MKTRGNTILITGGATGIGLALAKRLLENGNTVLICGRREERLREAKRMLPGVYTRQCDITKSDGRAALYDWTSVNFRDINVLVNNAGIQRPINLTKGIPGLAGVDDEIETNLRAQIHLSAHFVPLLMKRREAAIINVSSGLGFAPLAMFPIYSATKAAMHSFTLSLRHQLHNTPIKVFEVVPPGVHDTELKGAKGEKTEWSISAAEMADAIMQGLEHDQYEIAAGTSVRLLRASRDELDRAFSGMND